MGVSAGGTSGVIAGINRYRGSGGISTHEIDLSNQPAL